MLPPKAEESELNMSGVSEEKRFADTVKVLAEAIVYSVEKIHKEEPKQAKELGIVNPQLAKIGASIATSFDPAAQVEAFIKHTAQYWEEIRNKDREFFLLHAGNIFIPLQVSNVKMSIFFDIVNIKDAKGVPVISSDIEDEIWSLFHAMVKICLKYIHRKRRPYRKATEGNGEKRGYLDAFAPDIDLQQKIEEWKVKVIWPDLSQ
jgi:hypothetical protein